MEINNGRVEVEERGIVVMIWFYWGKNYCLEWFEK